MDIFNVLTMLGGLALFLFGMTIMGQALERRAGDSLRNALGKMTSGRLAGFLTGCGVTAVIQSSSATTVMVVGFVNSGLMTLKQAINVIMGANVGTTVTSWILSLSGIEGGNFWLTLLKPSSFTPVLALIGIIYYMFCKSSKKKDTGMILLGFATLMFGMETMSSAVSGLADIPAFRELFIMFKNPFLGVLAGAVLTAVIQSSSASVGILQVLAATGQVSYGAAIPIIMGQNIGTCITAIISSVGASKNAKRAAFVHLSFNVLGSLALLVVFLICNAVFAPAFLDDAASRFGIALFHTIFNVACVVILMPLASVLEKIALTVIRDSEKPETNVELDERLLGTPTVAIERCRSVAFDMAKIAVESLHASIKVFSEYTPELAKKIRMWEDETDHYEDILGTYLIKLSSRRMSDSDSEEVTAMLKIIGDYERIADHALNIVESAEELREKKLSLTDKARGEYEVIAGAINEIVDLSLKAFGNKDVQAAYNIEPLEQVIDDLKEQMRTRHIHRMQQGDCSIEVGFVWSDLLTNLERTSDHCSNIGGCIIDTAQHTLNIHETLKENKRENKDFALQYQAYAEKYALQ